MPKEESGTINQKIKALLNGYVDEVTPYFKEFFLEQKEYARKISPIALDMVERYENFLGGKRLRGYLTKKSYEMFAGEKDYDISYASLFVEAIHGFALVHDDIMDKDDLRRGEPTVHVQYEDLHDKSYPLGKNRKHYALSMAVNTGDLGVFFANLLVEKTNFPSERKMKLIKRMSEVFINTIYGQGLDVSFEEKEGILEEEVLQVHKYKTAYYTVTGPLQFGAILAGVDEADPRYKATEGYGLPVGVAFQLKDDEMGLFSSEERMGKPIYSDLRQGKVTLLFAKAFENADQEELEFLKSVHGNPNAKKEDLEKVKEIVVKTGALQYSQDLSEKLVIEGNKFIPEITKDKEYQELLNLISEFVISREK